MATATTPPRRITPTVAAAELARRDPVIAALREAAGVPKFGRPTETHFAALVRSITYQQLAGKAASTIHGRLVAALDGDVTPGAVLALDPVAMRAAGLSGNKAASIRDLAAKVEEGTVPLDSRALSRESDDDLVIRLSTVRGIGPWTAQMFLMFQLRRLDVWPVGDLGVRKGFGLAWGVGMPTPQELLALGEPFRPYRSIVAWYCWRATEIYAHAGPSALTR